MSAAVRILVVLAVAAVLPAQRVWIVDDDDRNADFADILPAIGAAQAGDTIVVRAGNYTNVWVTKPLNVLGEPGAVVNGSLIPVIEVTGIAAGQTATLRGLTVGPSSFATRPLWIHDNAGHVHLEQIESPFPMFVERNAQVSLHLVSLEGAPTLRVTDSTLLAVQCLSVAFPVVFTPNYGAVFERSHVTLAASVVEGGLDSFGFAGPGPAIDLLGGTLVLGGADTSILAGVGSVGSASAITSTGGTIRLDPAVRLVPANGAPPIAGTANVVNVLVPTTRAQVTGSQLTATVHGQAGQRSFLLGGLTLGPPVDTPFGQLWLGPHVLLDTGNIPANGRRSVTINLPPQGLGTLATLQAVMLNPNNSVELATPVALTID